MSIFDADALASFGALYPGRPGKLRHGLADHPLLTLESLVGLARNLGPGEVEYNAGDLPYGVDPAQVSHTGLSAEETIRRIEECGSWMVLKHVERDPAYRALLDAALDELAPVVEPATGEMLTRVGFIFVSSPDAVTPFHLDPEHNVLLHARGTKTMMIVPGDEAAVPAEKHEAYHVGGHRNVEWQDEFAERGHSFDLVPGDALHVPLKWPHWVRNGPTPSVSLSITWRTHWSYEEADARGFNALLRRTGLRPAAPAPFPERNRAKAFAHRALRRLRT